ncbi:MAG: VOC family protein [Gammaproteobacteria bacterium]|nr:VOC family protein [Gammaproteobacteria bacterium]
MNQRKHEKIDYIEFPAADLAAAKTFFAAVFDWSFEAFGDNYMAFSNAGIDGGFYRSDLAARAADGSALVVFYSAELECTRANIERAGGRIVKEVFAFPGGRRFHFADPNGNEFAVWSDLDADGEAIGL